MIQFLEGMPPQSNFEDYAPIRENMRAMTAQVIQHIGKPPSGTTETYHDIAMRDGYMSSIKIHRPAEDIEGPLIVLIFGGGFIAGNNDQSTPTARALVGLFNATVVNIDYRLSPEHKFPQAQLDAIDSLKWIAENAKGTLLSADPEKGFIIGGSSAGGCIAACLSRKFQEEKLAHPLTGQWLNIPITMSFESCPMEYRDKYISMQQNANAPVLPAKAIEMMIAQSGFDKTSDLGCAALSKTPISGQPRTYMQVCGMDPLRDDGLLYEEMLKQAGVPTKIDFYPGCPHGHIMLMAGSPLGNQANMDTLLGIGWLLGIDIPEDKATMAIGLRPKLGGS